MVVKLQLNLNEDNQIQLQVISLCGKKGLLGLNN